MVEVDPLVLAAGAAAIAVLSVVSCARSGKKSPKKESGENKEAKTEKKIKKSEKSEVVKAAAPAPAPAPAPKETVKASKGKSVAAPAAAEVAAAAPAPTKAVEVKPTAAVKSSAKAAAPAAPQVAPEVTPAAPAVAAETGDKKKKKETPEQRAARLERQKKRKEQPAEVTGSTPAELSSDERVEYVSRAPAADVWEVVEDKKKQKTKKTPPTASTEPTAATSSAETSAAIPADHTTSKLTVDPKKIGIIIGPKGATLRSIQELTEATINMPKADRDTNAKSASISIVGSVDAVQNATNIIIELCTKGYSTRLEGENFQESHLSVHNQFLSEIIGKSGASIRAIQDKLGVRITIPPTAAKDTTAMVKIGIAGDRENINRAKEVIREIMTYYHSPITHPGYVHVSLDIPQRMYNGIIGAKGGEIRHIQNNFKVAVHIPNPNSLTQHVIVVGEQSNQVDNAVRYIQKIVQQITTEEAKTATVVETWNEQSDLANTGEGEDPEPEWVSQYMYNREATKQVNLMAAVNVPISLSTAESNAWKMGDAADGW